MVEYIKTNRPGFSLDEAIEQTSPENCMIVKYESGLRKEYIEWNPLTEDMYNPKADPRYFRLQKIVMRSGEQLLGKDIPPGWLTAGLSPFIQIIYHIVLRGNITSREDIIRALIAEERIFSESDEDAIPVIEALLEYMNKENYYLLLHEGKLKVGFELPKAYHLVEYKRGYDPIEYQIMRYVEGRGMAATEEIYSYIMEYLVWLHTPSKIDYYLERLIKKGNLKRVQRNFFRYVRPLESNK